MKTRASLFILTAAAFSALLLPTVSAASKKVPAMAFPCSAVELPIARTIERGMTVLNVKHYLGIPHEKLTPAVWVYRGRFHASVEAANKNQCDTLVVTFVDGIVTDLHLVNNRAQQIIAARLQAGSSPMVAGMR